MHRNEEGTSVGSASGGVSLEVRQAPKWGGRSARACGRTAVGPTEAKKQRDRKELWTRTCLSGMGLESYFQATPDLQAGHQVGTPHGVIH